MFSSPEFLISIIPMLITLILIVFSLSLLLRFVRAVEKIADKFDSR